MKTIAAIYTAPALLEPLKNEFAELYPKLRLINIMDDSLIQDVIAANKMTQPVLNRIKAYCEAAEIQGADLILQTCSSVGRSVDLLSPFLKIPFIRIDRAMAEEAVSRFERIGVLATLPSTLEPTVSLVKQVSHEKSKQIKTVEGLAEGAFQSLVSGDSDSHDAKILETASSLKNECDCFLLAQGSMARMEERLASETGKPVLTSLRSGLLSLKSYLSEKSRHAE